MTDPIARRLQAHVREDAVPVEFATLQTRARNRRVAARLGPVIAVAAVAAGATLLAIADNPASDGSSMLVPAEQAPALPVPTRSIAPSTGSSVTAPGATRSVDPDGRSAPPSASTSQSEPAVTMQPPGAGPSGQPSTKTPVPTTSLEPLPATAPWGVVVGDPPSNDEADGSPGWVAPPAGRCVSRVFDVRPQVAPAPGLSLRVDAAPWNPGQVRFVEVPIVLSNEGTGRVSLSFKLRGQVIGAPTASREDGQYADLDVTLDPGETYRTSVVVQPSNCGDRSADGPVALPAGTYRNGVELEIPGIGFWFASSPPFTVGTSGS